MKRLPMTGYAGMSWLWLSWGKVVDDNTPSSLCLPVMGGGGRMLEAEEVKGVEAVELV